MAKRKDVREPSSETKAVTDAVAVNADAPPTIPGTSAEEALSATKAEEAAPQAANSEVKLPPVAQLQEPNIPAEPVVSPPPFLREHESRVIAARRAAPDPANPPKVAPPGAKEKPKSRFALLAATLALAAALGGTAGAIGIPALLHVTFGAAIAAAPASDAMAELQAIKGLVAQLATDLGALRTSVEQSNKATAAHFGKVTERLERAERAQAEPVAKLAKIGEAVERIERRAAAPAASAQNDVTGSVNAHAPAAETKPKPTIIEDYVVRKVFDGVALVEGRRGIIEVEPGSTLPGAGRVEEIRRQDGRWVVVTNKGLIVSAR